MRSPPYNFFTLVGNFRSAKPSSAQSSVYSSLTPNWLVCTYLLATRHSEACSRTFNTAAMSAVHKPRKKTKKDNANEGSSASQDSAVVSEGSLQKPAFPLASFLWPARKGTSQWVILPLTLMVAGLFRWAIGLWGYSGESSLPITERIR